MRYSRLEAALDEALNRGETGVQVAVADASGVLWSGAVGLADRRTGRPVDDRTVFPVYSVTKAFTATAIHLQVDRGLVDLDALMTDYWPEYGQEGKGATTVRDALTHRAGLPDMPADLTPEQTGDWSLMTTSLAAMAPVFPPGTTNAYHAATWGWLVGEIVRRTDPDGREPAQFVGDEILTPLGIAESWFGLPPSEDDRLARVHGALSVAGRPPVVLEEDATGPELWRLGSPSGGMITTAASAVPLFAMLANGGRYRDTTILDPNRIRACLAPRVDALADDVRAKRVRYIGCGGYWLGGEAPPAEPLVGNGHAILWHPGAGGSAGWADLDRGIGVVICHNRTFDWEALDRDVHPFGAIADAIDELDW